jgi:hypothetical protein
MTLQFVDDGAQPIALTSDARDLLGMTHTLGDEQRRQPLVQLAAPRVNRKRLLPTTGVAV